MPQPLSAFNDTTLYLDTMVFYAFLRSSDPATRELFVRIRTADVLAYTSVLTFDELTYRMLLAMINDTYDGPAVDHLREDESQMLTQFYPRLAPVLTQLRTFPNLTVFDVSAIDLMLMDENIKRYRLPPRDALHLSAMQKSGCFDVVSSNPDFERVPEVRRYTLDGRADP